MTCPNPLAMNEMNLLRQGFESPLARAEKEKKEKEDKLKAEAKEKKARRDSISLSARSTPRTGPPTAMAAPESSSPLKRAAERATAKAIANKEQRSIPAAKNPRAKKVASLLWGTAPGPVA